MCWTHKYRVQCICPMLMLIATYYNLLFYDCLQNQKLVLQGQGSGYLFCSLYAQHLELDLTPVNTSVNICCINEWGPENAAHR